jgi:transposase
MPKAYSLDLRERVVGFVEDGHSRRAAAAHFQVSVSFVVNLVKAVRTRGSFEPKPSGGRRHAKLEPHRSFLLAQVAEKADITMPELAAELAAATGEKANPASLSRWLIGIGYRVKTYGSRRSQEGLSRLALDQSASTYPASEVFPAAKMVIRALRSSAPFDCQAISSSPSRKYLGSLAASGAIDQTSPPLLAFRRGRTVLRAAALTRQPSPACWRKRRPPRYGGP